MMQIEAKENLIIKACRESCGDIYIYGAGEMGRRLALGLLKNRISVAGFLIDSEFWNAGESYCGIPVCSMDETPIEGSALIIVAIKSYDRQKVETLKRRANIVVLDALSFFLDSDNYDDAFLEKHDEELTSLYGKLADDKSRVHMLAYINQKVSGDFKYLKNIWETNQYYDSNIVDFSGIASFVDCGAYDGDSYQSFLDNYRMHTGKEYNGIAYLLEPVNYEKCLLACGTDKRCRILPIGAWDCADKLPFTSEGTSSSISGKGTLYMDVDTIDNILGGGRADFIKMDLEGSELKALQGARMTIERHRPILAICVYHKKEDLITMPQYIESLYSGYQFYIRAYSEYAQELVLYAIP